MTEIAVRLHTPKEVLGMSDRYMDHRGGPLAVLTALADLAIEWERKHILYVAAVKARGEEPLDSGSVREAFTYRQAFDRALMDAANKTWRGLKPNGSRIVELCEHLKKLSGANMYLPGWAEYVAERDAVKP